MPKILIIEDDDDINHMIADFLSKQGYVCTSAFSGTEGSLLFQMHSFDLILMDLMLPGEQGESVLQNIRASSHVPVIAISAKDALDDKVHVLTLGANDYICKPFALQELLARIQVQLRNTVSADRNEYIRFEDITMNILTFEVTVADQLISLTKHEFMILRCMLEHPRQVFSKQQIYEYAWGEQYYGDDKTINVHISNLRAKLNQGKNDYIQTVWGIGFKLKSS